MNPNKFKVGDIVRCISFGYNPLRLFFDWKSRPYLDSIYVVEEVHSNGRISFKDKSLIFRLTGKEIGWNPNKFIYYNNNEQ